MQGTRCKQRPLNTSEMPYEGYVTDLLGRHEFVLVTQNTLLLAKGHAAKHFVGYLLPGSWS